MFNSICDDDLSTNKHETRFLSITLNFHMLVSCLKRCSKSLIEKSCACFCSQAEQHQSAHTRGLHNQSQPAHENVAFIAKYGLWFKMIVFGKLRKRNLEVDRERREEGKTEFQKQHDKALTSLALAIWWKRIENTEKEKRMETEREEKEWESGLAIESYKSPIKLSALIALQLNVHFLCLHRQGWQLHFSSWFTLCVCVGGCIPGCKSQPLVVDSEWCF